MLKKSSLQCKFLVSSMSAKKLMFFFFLNKCETIFFCHKRKIVLLLINFQQVIERFNGIMN
eukprot:TRINITY_DN2241_c0_g1_i1.p1 TRINITY_DN2241_c0_g1~~TRINITY_DN2241_c0_g1_i1.p1  ORF type:complete len:61 (-),score=10.39 TRINITY_DN2241_c0_g1_i1:229-411(-)